RGGEHDTLPHRPVARRARAARRAGPGRRGRRALAPRRPLAPQRPSVPLIEPAMITTIVLIQAEPRLIPKAAAALAGIEGVTDVYSVSGEWDLIAILKVAEYERIAETVTEKVPLAPGLAKTPPLAAPRACTRADLGHAWDLGVD